MFKNFFKINIMMILILIVILIIVVSAPIIKHHVLAVHIIHILFNVFNVIVVIHQDIFYKQIIHVVKSQYQIHYKYFIDLFKGSVC